MGERANLRQRSQPNSAVIRKPSMVDASDENDAGSGHYAPPSSIASEPERRGREATLTTMPLAIIMFYSTSGGPFGIEGGCPCLSVG